MHVKVADDARSRATGGPHSRRLYRGAIDRRGSVCLGLQGQANRQRDHRRPQSAPATVRRRSPVRNPVSQRIRGRTGPQPPEHRPDSRCRPGRRDHLLRHGLLPRVSRGSPRAVRPALGARDGGPGKIGRAGPSLRTRRGRGPPRHQGRQHPARRGRASRGGRLRHCQSGIRVRVRHGPEHDHRDPALCVARAGTGTHARRPQRSVCPRGDALQGRDGQRAV